MANGRSARDKKNINKKLLFIEIFVRFVSSFPLSRVCVWVCFVRETGRDGCARFQRPNCIFAKQLHSFANSASSYARNGWKVQKQRNHYNENTHFSLSLVAEADVKLCKSIKNCVKAYKCKICWWGALKSDLNKCHRRRRCRAHFLWSRNMYGFLNHRIYVSVCVCLWLCWCTIENNKNWDKEKCAQSTRLQRNGNDDAFYSARQQFFPKKITLFPSARVRVFRSLWQFFISGASSTNWSVCIFGLLVARQRVKIHWFALYALVLHHLMSTDLMCAVDQNGPANRIIHKFIPASSVCCSFAIRIKEETICMQMEMKMANGQSAIKGLCLIIILLFRFQQLSGRKSRELLFIGSQQMIVIDFKFGSNAIAWLPTLCVHLTAHSRRISNSSPAPTKESHATKIFPIENSI